MPRGFRVRSLEIEGFKGFAKPKKLDIGDRHIFLLGSNGHGKSSIVEAIRWGLFGNRPNDVVASRHYSGDCQVTISLVRDDKQWSLRRTLVPGTNRTRDPELTDEFGNSSLIREVIPSLDSSNIGEGMHIIFSSQSAPLQRQPANLNSFQRTVLNHLGLLRPESLRTQIGEFLKENEELVARLDDRLTQARQKIDSEIARLQQRRREFLNSPPWGNESQPTLGDSKNKARALIQEISGAPVDDSVTGVLLTALIADAAEALEQRQEQNMGELELQSNAIGLRRQKLENLRNRIGLVDSAESYSQFIRSQIESDLGNMTSEDIRKKRDAAKAAMSVAELKAQIVDATISLLELGSSEDVACPICDVEHPLPELREAVNQHKEATDDTNNKTANLLREQEALLEKAEDLESKMQEGEKALESAKQARIGALSNVDAEDKEFAEGATREDLIEKITQLQNRGDSITEQINRGKDALNNFERRLSNLRDEDRFHNLGERLTAQHGRRTNFERRVQREFETLVAFGESARKVHEVVEECFNERMKDEIPSVSGRLSKVFVGLTRHPHYDKLVFDESHLPNLTLRVASSEDDASPTDISVVLNGQAQEALTLVPYFAFSQSDDANTEMHLFMLDDPTRAFDEEHTDILVEHLAQLGQRVQIIVASQETERFRDLLPKHFSKGSYVIVEPTNWSRAEGPELSVEYE